MSAEHFSWICRWGITFLFFFFDYESKNCAEMHFASAADHTTVFLHSYPIKQIKLWDSGNHLINFYRVWWQGKVEHGVRIMLLVRQNGLDRDKISSIALNSLGPTRQGQKYVFAKGENVITNSCNAACVFVWFCVHVRSSPWAQKKNKKQNSETRQKSSERCFIHPLLSSFAPLLCLAVCVSWAPHVPSYSSACIGKYVNTYGQQIKDPQEHKKSNQLGPDHKHLCLTLFKQKIRRICWVKKK